RRGHSDSGAGDSRHRAGRSDRVLRSLPRSEIIAVPSRSGEPFINMHTAILAAASTGDMVREVGETFGFDWKIFFSQVISFVIVALVLRRFAYKPILAVLEERRQRIAEGLMNSEKIKQQLAEAEQRHAEILAHATAQDRQRVQAEASRHGASWKEARVEGNNALYPRRSAARAPRILKGRTTKRRGSFRRNSFAPASPTASLIAAGSRR